MALEKKSTQRKISMKKENSNDGIETKKSSPIHGVLQIFLDAIDDYREAVITIIPNVAKNKLDQLKDVAGEIDNYTKNADKDGSIFLKDAIDVKNFYDAIKQEKKIKNSRLLPLIARSFFIGLFTEYDRFIGALMQEIYRKKPELYKSIKKEISLSELLDFANIEEIKRDLLDQEIDSFRRGSYVDQFSDLEKKFDIASLKKFDDWPKFVELAQRRNIMTHNGGCVSQQYIFMCEKEGVNFEKKPKIGEELTLYPQYILDAIRTISNVGFMLTHTLWRKLFPEETSIANDSMNDSIYYLLSNRRWKAASEFGQFALSNIMAKEASDMTKRVRVINTAIAYKFDKKPEKAIHILESMDWSASIREFKLANAVLKGNEKEAGIIMKEIGQKGEVISELDYYDWPLFEEFRGTEDFQNAFQEIYGSPFKDKLSTEARKIQKRPKSAKIQKDIAKISSNEQ